MILFLPPMSGARLSMPSIATEEEFVLTEGALYDKSDAKVLDMQKTASQVRRRRSAL